MPDISNSQMIIAYLQEDGLSNEDVIEVLKSTLRIIEHQEVQEALNKLNKQIKMFEV